MSIFKKKIKTNSRVLHELLTKYRNTFTALCELINNSLQAKAKNISLIIEYGDLVKMEPFIKQIILLDDGVGVSKSDFEHKILEIGTTAKIGGQGIGRFGALQIGSKMEIETVGYDREIGKFPERGTSEIVNYYKGRFYIVSLGEKKIATFGLPHVFVNDIDFAIDNAFDCYRIAKWLESIENMDAFIQDGENDIKFFITDAQHEEYNKGLGDE